MNASFEERSVWIQLVSLTVALGAYFVVAGLMISKGIEKLVAFVPLFIVAVVMIVTVNVIGHIWVAITGRVDRRDERDRLIAWRSEGNAAWLLGAGVILAIIGLILDLGNLWVAHWLLLCLFLSQVMGYIWQLVYYRRGI